MLQKPVWALNPHTKTFKTGRGRTALPIFLGLAVVILLLGCERPARADDDANSAKVSATAYLRVAMNRDMILGHATTDRMLTPAAGANGQTEYEIFKNTQRQFLLSPLVLRAALNQPGIGELAVIKNQKNPIDWLGRNLQVTFPGNAEIMKVSLAGASQKELATLVNAVVDAYMTEVVGVERKKLDDCLNELKNIQVRKSEEVKNELNELRIMAKSLGTSDTETLNLQQKNTLDELQIVRSESIRGTFELNRMAVELASQKAALQAVQEAPIPDIACELFASSDFILRKLQEEILTQERSSDAKNQAELERLKKKYAERIEQIRGEINRKSLGDIEKEIKKLEAAIAVAKQQQDVVQEEVKQLRKEADRFGMTSIDMQMRRKSIENSQKSLDSITMELESLNVERHTQPRVTVVEKAEARE